MVWLVHERGSLVILQGDLPTIFNACAEEQKGLLPILRKKLCRLRVSRIYPETPDVKTFRELRWGPYSI